MSAIDTRVLYLERTKTLTELTIGDLHEFTAWAYVPQDIEDLEGPVAPVRLNVDGKVPAAAAEVWCRCDAEFANGTRHDAVGVCEANGHTGPLAVSVFLGEDAVRVMVHPAPDFVLAKEGPTVFAARFGLPVDQVFPITVVVRATFEDPPMRRKAVFSTSGRV